MTPPLIQADDGGLAQNPNHVVLIGDGSTDAHAGSFWIGIDPLCECRRFFAQIVEPQSNINLSALGRFDPMSVTRLMELLAGRGSRDALIHDQHLYKALVCGMMQEDSLSALTLRPNIGTTYTPASESDIVHFIGLPFTKESKPIGNLLHCGIPLNIDRRTFWHNSLVAGRIGSGKTTLVANLNKIASDQGFFVVVLDPKPDYQFMDEPNPKRPDGSAIKDVRFFSLSELNRVRPPGDEQLLSVPAGNLELKSLAAAVFHSTRDDKYVDDAEFLLEKWVEDSDCPEGDNWTWNQFRDWIKEHIKEPELWGGAKPHSGTVDAFLRRLVKLRPPAWVDRLKTATSGVGVHGLFSRDNPGEKFSLRDLAEPGRVIVLRIPPSEAGARDYALLLTYLMREAFKLRPEITMPILFLVDEAQDLFRGSQQFVRQVTDSLSLAVRKGRSQHIGFTFAVQNASSVPAEILNNLLSQFLGAHQNTDVVAKACGDVFDRDLLSQLPTLGPGEFLVRLHESRAAVQCKSDLSPFKLYEVTL